MQQTYITALYDIMIQDSRVCSLLSDSGTDYDILMARELPNQCFNFGIAEQNKVACASGMAAMGKIPFVYTTGSFLAYRAYEFIRDDICFQTRNVKLVGMGMGMGSWSTLGPSHHTTEDIAALRVLPNLVLLSAATPLELRQMVRYAYEYEGAVYIRMGMSGEEELYAPDYRFEAGKLSILLEGSSKIVIYTTGTIAAEVCRAALRLGASVYNISTINPIDSEGILQTASGGKMIFTVEEHQLRGGIGGAIAEILAENEVGVPLRRMGLDNRFAIGYGTTGEVRKYNRLDSESIYQHVKTAML